MRSFLLRSMESPSEQSLEEVYREETFVINRPDGFGRHSFWWPADEMRPENRASHPIYEESK